MIYFEYILILYCIINKKFIFSSNYIFHLQNYHTNILYLYNSYREFFCDENSIIFGIPVYDFLIKKEEELYSTSTNDIDKLTTNIIFINNLKEQYIQLTQNIFCNKFINDYFKNKEECLKYIGLEDELKNLGFNFLVHNFIEDIRIKRNYVKLLYDNNLIVGSFIDYYYDYEITDNERFRLNNTNILFKLDLFNDNEIHAKLNIIFLHIILPYIEEERKLFFNTIENNLKNGEYIYIILIICHIIFITLTTLIFWIPQIKKMSEEIHKTKNILSIIPLKILSSLPNIKLLLNIISYENHPNPF